MRPGARPSLLDRLPSRGFVISDNSATSAECAAELGSQLPFLLLWTAETSAKLFAFGGAIL